MSESLKLEDEPGDVDQNLDMRDEEDDIEEWNRPSTSNDAGNDNDQEDISMKNDEGSDEEDDEEEENNSGFSKVNLTGRFKYTRFKKSVYNEATMGNVVVCRLCNWKLPYNFNVQCQNRSFLAHLKSSHTEAYCCLTCPYACVSEIEIRWHMKRVHKNNKNKRIFYRCTICPKVFKKSQELRLHWHVEHNSIMGTGVKSYPCTLCGGRFFSPATLLKHIKGYHPNAVGCDLLPKPHTRERCPACKTVLSSEKAMINHIEKVHRTTVHNGGMFKCNLSPFTTAEMGALESHVSYSHKEVLEKRFQTFPCRKCGQVFDCRDTLTRHLTGIRGMKLFQCKYCEKTYSYKCTLQKHVEREHPTSLEATQGPLKDKQMKVLLPKKNNSSKVQSIPLEDKLLKDKNLKCLCCDYKTSSHSDLVSHMSEHSNLKESFSNNCSFCNITFDSPSQQRKHYLLEHFEFNGMSGSRPMPPTPEEPGSDVAETEFICMPGGGDDDGSEEEVTLELDDEVQEIVERDPLALSPTNEGAAAEESLSADSELDLPNITGTLSHLGFRDGVFRRITEAFSQPDVPTKVDVRSESDMSVLKITNTISLAKHADPVNSKQIVVIGTAGTRRFVKVPVRAENLVTQQKPITPEVVDTAGTRRFVKIPQRIEALAKSGTRPDLHKDVRSTNPVPVIEEVWSENIAHAEPIGSLSLSSSEFESNSSRPGKIQQDNDVNDESATDADFDTNMFVSSEDHDPHSKPMMPIILDTMSLSSSELDEASGGSATTSDKGVISSGPEEAAPKTVVQPPISGASGSSSPKGQFEMPYYPMLKNNTWIRLQKPPEANSVQRSLNGSVAIPTKQYLLKTPLLNSQSVSPWRLANSNTVSNVPTIDCSKKTVPHKRTKLYQPSSENSFSKDNIPSTACSEQPRKSAMRQPKSSVGDVRNTAQPSSEFNSTIPQCPKTKRSSTETDPQRATTSSIQSEQQHNKHQPDSEKIEEDITSTEVVPDISLLAEPKPISEAKTPNEGHACDQCRFVAPGSLDLMVHQVREHCGNLCNTIPQSPKTKRSSRIIVPTRATTFFIQSEQQQKNQPDSEMIEEDLISTEVASDISLLAEPKPVSGSKKPNEGLACDKCQYVAFGPIDLKVLEMYKHWENKEIFTFECPHCTYHSTQEKHMKLHLREDHQDDLLYWCPYCEFSTDGLDMFLVHRLVHMAMSCSTCGFTPCPRRL